MKIKFLIITILFTFSLGLTSCSEECEPTLTTCSEAPPTNEICQAFFTNWFYNAEKNKCEEIGYSGCSSLGFATETECEACLCNK